jgi:hypothetical protein
MKTRGILGLVALALVVTGILANMQSIKRYIRISTM